MSKSLDSRLTAVMRKAEKKLAALDQEEPLRQLKAFVPSPGTMLLAEGDGRQVGSAFGMEGIPWRSGVQYSEDNPALRPFLARGVSQRGGVWRKLSTTPPARAALWALMAPLVAAPWSLQEPDEPFSDDPVEASIRARHWAYCRALWRRWTAPGRDYTVPQFFEHILRYAVFEAGFYVGEAAGYSVLRVDGREVPAFDLPELRRPDSVREWVFSGETPVAMIQDILATPDVSDAQGRVTIPFGRLVHVAHNSAGRTDLEGQSILRGAYPILEALILLYQLQPLAVETNALGTVWIEQDKDLPIPEDEHNRITDHLSNYQSEHVPWGILPPGAKVSRDRATDGVMDLTPIINTFERQAYLAMGGGQLLVAVQQHGSYAAQKGASADARDSLDYYATLCAHALEKYLRVCLTLAFPGEEPYVPHAVYTQVEERDNGAYMGQLASYLRDVRPHLSESNQRRLDEMMDLTTGETTETADGQTSEAAVVADQTDAQLLLALNTQ
jgi:hypothetical protein